MLRCLYHHLNFVEHLLTLEYWNYFYKTLYDVNINNIYSVVYYLRSLHSKLVYPTLQPFLHCPLCFSHEELFRQWPLQLFTQSKPYVPSIHSVTETVYLRWCTLNYIVPEQTLSKKKIANTEWAVQEHWTELVNSARTQHANGVQTQSERWAQKSEMNN